MLQEGKLSYYTYNYDHPPFGWLVIGLWAQAVGGFLAFGNSIDTARVLMWVVCLVSTLLIFLIVRRATGSIAAGAAGALLFAASPLGISLHRQVWLDNLATAWLLLAVYLSMSRRQGLHGVLLSGIAFGLCFWTKEIMIVCCSGDAGHCRRPCARGASPLRARSLGRNCRFGGLRVRAVGTAQGRLLPPVCFGLDVAHVSLIETYRWQMSRGGAGSLLSATSDFRRYLDQWWQGDQLACRRRSGHRPAWTLLDSHPAAPARWRRAARSVHHALPRSRRSCPLLLRHSGLAVFALGMGLLSGYVIQRLGRVRPLLGVAAAVLLVAPPVCECRPRRRNCCGGATFRSSRRWRRTPRPTG